MRPVLEESRPLQSLLRSRADWLLALCFMLSCGALTTRAFTSTDADTLFEAHTKAFYQEKDGRAWFKENTEDDKKVSYWMRAERKRLERSWTCCVARGHSPRKHN